MNETEFLLNNPEARALPPGADFRRPEYRREVFQRFYSFHLKYRTHPGCVYFVLPYLARELGWDLEQRLWAAYLNGNTQNPVTTFLLMQQGDRPAMADKVLAFYKENFKKLQWDTDRRHHKSKLEVAVSSYLREIEHHAGGTQEQFWRHWAETRGGWAEVWTAARRLWGFGRLSAWSYLEYVRILARPEIAMPDSNTLYLHDIDGSQSHRNGLCVVLGRDELVWDGTLNPGSKPDVYTPDILAELQGASTELLHEAEQRNPGHPDVGRLTLESALCTYKSWHKPNRRYPNVYTDMLHDRLRWAEGHWGQRFELIWEARFNSLPMRLLQEHNPKDPGLCPEKQNFYRENGCPVMMSVDWPVFDNPLDRRIFG